MADAIKNRNHLANLIALASDDAKSAPLRHQLRSLEKEIMKDRSAVSDPARDAQLAQLAPLGLRALQVYRACPARGEQLVLPDPRETG